MKKRYLKYLIIKRNSNEDEIYEYREKNLKETVLNVLKNYVVSVIAVLSPIWIFCTYCYERGFTDYFNVSSDNINIDVSKYSYSLMIILFAFFCICIVVIVQVIFYDLFKPKENVKKLCAAAWFLLVVICCSLNDWLPLILNIGSLFIVSLLYVANNTDLKMNSECKGKKKIIKNKICGFFAIVYEYCWLNLMGVIAIAILLIAIIFLNYTLLYDLLFSVPINWGEIDLLVLGKRIWVCIQSIMVISFVLSPISTAILVGVLGVKVGISKEDRDNRSENDEESSHKNENKTFSKVEEESKKNVSSSNVDENNKSDRNKRWINFFLICYFALLIIVILLQFVRLGRMTAEKTSIDRYVAFQANDSFITPVMKKNLNIIKNDDMKEYYLYYVVYENKDSLCLKPIQYEGGVIINLKDSKPDETTTYIVNKSKVDVVYTFSNPKNVKKSLKNDGFTIPKK